jgi:hypothetical protein
MELSENPTHFASVLRINRLTVSKYESDQFVGGMPDTLAHALVSSSWELPKSTYLYWSICRHVYQR